MEESARPDAGNGGYDPTDPAGSIAAISPTQNPRRRGRARKQASEDGISAFHSQRNDSSRTGEETFPGGYDRESAAGTYTPGTAAEVLTQIGIEFARLREQGGRSEAWAALQGKLSRNLGVIVPEAASLEQTLSMMLKIEEFRKSEQAHGRAPGDVVGEWLQGEDVPVKGKKRA